jgi:hypothetical protein
MLKNLNHAGSVGGVGNATTWEDTLMTRPVQSLAAEEPTLIDAGTAWAHLNLGDAWRSRRIGAHNVAYSEARGYLQFDMHTGDERTHRVIVKLAVDDTYAVELGQMRTIPGTVPGVDVEEYAVLRQVRGLFADQLGPEVEGLFREVAR